MGLLFEQQENWAIAPIIKTSWLNTQNWQVFGEDEINVCVDNVGTWKRLIGDMQGSTWQIRHWLNTNFIVNGGEKVIVGHQIHFHSFSLPFDPHFLELPLLLRQKTLTKNKTCTSRNRDTWNDMSNFSRLRLQGFKSFVEKSDLGHWPGLTGNCSGQTVAVNRIFVEALSF